MDTDPDAVRLATLLPEETFVVGIKQAAKAVNGNRAKRIYAAQDSDPIQSAKIEELLAASGYEADYSYTREQLGHFCGIDVGASIVVILDK